MNAAWDRAFLEGVHDEAGRRTPLAMRFGLRAWATPPWAQDIGAHADTPAILRLLAAPPAPLVVLDLAPGIPAPESLPPGCWTLERHTRQVALTGREDPIAAWPAHRRKQFNRAEREGMQVHRIRDVRSLVALHQASRTRKGLSSDAEPLERLMSELLKEPGTQAWEITNAAEETLAGGLFHGSDDGRCIYGFGGQFRNATPGDTSRATVLLIGTAQRHAAAQGDGCFDFGGSADPGVDRFYAEFNAEKVNKARLVYMAPMWRPLLRLRRPDLFPR